MESYLPENEYKEFEGRLYSNPQVSVDEANAFIDNLRSAQGQQNQEIIQQTQNLGTDIPANLGGLTGAESYFTSRYQTPQTNANVANLRATAQAAALNEVLANEQAKWKKRYQDAYRAYQKSAYNRSLGGSPISTDIIEGVVDETGTTRTVGSVEPDFTPLDYSGNYSYNFSPNALSTGIIDNVTLAPGGRVDITRDSSGNVTALTYNGLSFSGDAAQKRYDWLQSNGTLSKIGD